jgi:hypothetical protein
MGIFEAAVSKAERVNPESVHHGKISSYRTMETYWESVWNPFGEFVKAEHGVKDFEKITAAHVVAYMERKHTFATRLVQAGVDLYTVQKLGRWKRASRCVERYAHHCPESLRPGVEVLDRFITNLSQLPQNQ